MLWVLLNWGYILLTAFLCGFAFARLIGRLSGYRIGNVVEILFFGLAIATVYAQLFSLFSAVGALANVLLILACIAVFLAWRKEIAALIRSAFCRRSLFYKISTIILILLWCYCTSRGYMHYDSDLYHAQSIRWIEEYGVVKGLGNIHVRLAYNSSFFALSALYSMRDIAGQSLHTANGFIALLLSLEALGGFTGGACGERKKTVLSDFARLGAVYYLTLLYREIVAPASDYCVMCVVFYIMIRWLAKLEEGEKDGAPYALLCVLGVYGVTLKLTAGIILLLVVKPAYLLLKNRRYREIAAYIGMGALVLAPWMIRTALLSGYLLYPFPALDVLKVDWKIDAAAAALDAAEIKTWGRGLYDASLAGLPVWEWFGQWFSALAPLEKLFIAADIACAAVFIALCAVFIVRLFRKKAVRGMADGLLVLAAVAASYLFWQLSAPLLRYGYAYVFLLPALTAGLLYQRIWGSSRIVLAAVCALAAVKVVSLFGWLADTAGEPYYVRQQDYGSYAVESFEADGVTLYYPTSGDRVGYAYFPAVPRQVEIELRGEDISEGFRGK